MTTSERNTTIQEVKAFTYPKLYTGKEWYVGFMAFDPAQKKMRRKKIKLNHIEKKAARRTFADGLMKRLVQQLERGWNPWMETQATRSLKTFDELCNHYQAYIDKQTDEGLLRKDSQTSYQSKLRILRTWNAQRPLPITYAYQFDRQFICELLEHVYEKLNRSATTRNNYLSFCCNLSQFMVEKQYATTKPSEGIPFISKTKLRKARTIISDKDIARLYQYLSQHNPHYLLACYILHYCFVRRKEMSHLQLHHFNLKEQTLYIPGSISKNRNDAVVTLPQKIVELMIDLQTFNHPPHYYLFSHNFQPGSTRKSEKQFTDFWAYHIRKDLKFPAHYQFYSLKDTGITEMLLHYDVLTVRDQARHSDIKMTDTYTPHQRKTANQALIKHQGKL